ncbi:YgjV family protein [Parendozoicomonas sp. Alg238-R29]|uniref:YgjV family protein n=1 Tax=Parendozoicomonas sp. Alg238-R29 TaxID=2993446 RepID=UPI00248D9730|nr:YgjV family protein [Parendozoicomonas sp. Alg238-R29]
MSEIDWLEMLGYFATLLTAVSLSMSSLVRLRWFNMFGSFCFGTYGLLLGALPVVLLNYYLVAMNMFYLWKMYNEKSHFRVLPASVSDQYLNEFINLHKSEIKEFFPPFSLRDDREYTALMIHRDLSLAGVFICHRNEDNTMEVDLDFVLPPYRDLKPGQFVFCENSKFFTEQGVSKIVSAEGSEDHATYLAKIGFSRTNGRLEMALQG